MKSEGDSLLLGLDRRVNEDFGLHLQKSICDVLRSTMKIVNSLSSCADSVVNKVGEAHKSDSRLPTPETSVDASRDMVRHVKYHVPAWVAWPDPSRKHSQLGPKPLGLRLEHLEALCMDSLKHQDLRTITDIL